VLRAHTRRFSITSPWDLEQKIHNYPITTSRLEFNMNYHTLSGAKKS